jgi:hypothetical protein
MSDWKVLLIGVLACACFALGLSTVLVLLTHEGNQRWLWGAAFCPPPPSRAGCSCSSCDTLAPRST